MPERGTRFFVYFLIGVVSLWTFFAGCSKEGGSSPEAAPPAAVSQNHNRKAGTPTIDPAVKACIDAHNHLFGPEGCLPNQFSQEKIQASCRAYSAWSAKGYSCGDEVVSEFFKCLSAIECSALDFEEDELAYKRGFLTCHETFVQDLDGCWTEGSYP